MNQITFEDAVRHGIDMSMTAVCRKAPQQMEI